MRLLVLTMVAGLGLGVFPEQGAAQTGRARGRIDREVESVRRDRQIAAQRAERRDVDDRIADILRGRSTTRDRDDDRYYERNRNTRVKRSNGNGPAFCRSGQGHPVHGRQWCRDKGWGLGNDRGDRWEERRERDRVILRRERDRDRGRYGDDDDDDDDDWERERSRERRRDGGGALDRVGDIMRGRTR